jgi:hypothetical protein
MDNFRDMFAFGGGQRPTGRGTAPWNCHESNNNNNASWDFMNVQGDNNASPSNLMGQFGQQGRGALADLQPRTQMGEKITIGR